MTEFKQNDPSPLMALQLLFGGDGSPNQLLNGDGFYISFHPSTDVGPETALVKDDIFRNLLGDHRTAYAGIYQQGFDACLAFFNEHKAEHGSVWSTLEEDRP